MDGRIYESYYSQLFSLDIVDDGCWKEHFLVKVSSTVALFWKCLWGPQVSPQKKRKVTGQHQDLWWEPGPGGTVFSGVGAVRRSVRIKRVGTLSWNNGFCVGDIDDWWVPGHRDIRLPYMTNRIWTWATKKDFCIPTVFKIGYQNTSKQFHGFLLVTVTDCHGRQAFACFVVGDGLFDEVHPKLMVCLYKVIWLIFPLEHQSFGRFFLGVFFCEYFWGPLEQIKETSGCKWIQQEDLWLRARHHRSIHGSKQVVFISRICLREMVAAMPPYMSI